jgi:sigma-54 dependent transcriptional regulator, acetoin dehydrogenase operon transcriptional activator AcoR
VCATHRTLRSLVEGGAFRADLYFRIAQYTTELPPVRALPDRDGLVRELWARLGGPASGISLSPDCEHLLARYDWPGNFRQLVGTLRAMIALADPGQTLSPEALPPALRSALAENAEAGAPRGVGRRTGDLEAITRLAMREALDACDGNVSRAARKLGINRSTLYRRLLGSGDGPRDA